MTTVTAAVRARARRHVSTSFAKEPCVVAHLPGGPRRGTSASRRSPPSCRLITSPVASPASIADAAPSPPPAARTDPTSTIPSPSATGSSLAPDAERVTAVLPRRSALTRRAAGEPTGAQTLAANIDHVLLVHGLDRRRQPPPPRA